MKRRTFLQMVGTAVSYAGWRRSLFADNRLAAATDEFFIFIHAVGGWDVTLCLDPRNEHRGLVDPASTANTEVGQLKLWKGVPLDSSVRTFEILAPSDVPMRFGPGIGDLYDLRDRLTVVNGLAMNTVSHPDGITYSSTGRHLQGGRSPASSVDVMVANELGASQLIPDIAVKFPSWYVGEQLDRHAVPLRINEAAAIAKSFGRSDQYLTAVDRQEISALLAVEAGTLAQESNNREPYDKLEAQVATSQQLIDDKLASLFTQSSLQTSYPMFDYKGNVVAEGLLSAAFALEAIRRNLVRCVGFSLGAFDTHSQNYREHAFLLQALFGGIATLVKQLDTIPHPTRNSSKLADHTHIFVFSDFCRTPSLNLAGGRDHYPNNSALVISPRLRVGTFGKTDAEQLLADDAGVHFAGGARPLTPPDLIATFLHAFGINPAPYVRDGEVVAEMLVQTK
jgi:hypothetical protein